MREGLALPADQSPRPPLSAPEQGDGKQSELPRLHFPQRPDGQGLAPAPGGYPPPPPPPPPPGGGQVPPGGPPPGGGQVPPGGPPPRGGQVPPGGPPPGTPPPAPPGAPPDWAQRWGPQPGPGGPGPRRPARPAQPLRSPEPATRQRAVAALILGLLSLLSLLAIGSLFNFHRSLYLVIFALAVGISACWIGITAMRRSRLAATMRPRGAIAGIVLGAIGALLSAFVLVFFAAFWQQLNTYSQCLSQAQTPSAQQACANQWDRSTNLTGLMASRPRG